MTNDSRLTDRAIASALSARLARTAPPGLLDSAMARIANTPQHRPGLGRLAAQPFGVVRVAWILILLALFAAIAVTLVAVGSRPLSVATVVNGRIAFAPATGDGIRVIDPDGTNETRLVDGTVSSPRWSPDGRRIAFVRLVDAENSLFELFLIDADGTNARQLTSGSAGPIHSLAWAPDGSRIAFVYEPTSDDPDVSITQRQIRVVPVETWEPLTVYQHQMALMGGWSPDGTRLLVYPEGVWDDGGIFAARSDGSGVEQLTEPRPGVQPATSISTPGGYSPDGSRILFWTGKDGLGRIEVMNADGSQRQFVTEAGTLSEFQPTWSRDGQRIAYSRWEPGTTEESRRAGWEDVEIWVMNADGTGPTRLTPGHDPTFSPDGQRVLFYRDDEPGVYVMNSRDGTGVAKLIDEHAMVDWQAISR